MASGNEGTHIHSWIFGFHLEEFYLTPRSHFFADDQNGTGHALDTLGRFQPGRKIPGRFHNISHRRCCGIGQSG